MTAPGKILCIEDDPEILELIIEVLSEAGFDPQPAPDGLIGLSLLEDRPDLVLCDIDMPGMSGFNVLERVRGNSSTLRHIPFLFLTAFGSRENQIKAYRLGCDDYIMKPIDFEILIEIVHRQLQRRRLDTPASAEFRLTEREVEVMTWVTKGKSSSEIAVLTGISERTVNFHIDNVLRKTGTKSRVQAAVLCAGLGFVRP